MASSFTIDQVSWHTGTKGNPETRAQIVRRFSVIVQFLQSSGLTVRDICRDETEIDDNFAIVSDDLTDEGLAIMKTTYDKWLQKVDTGMLPEDVSLLTHALERARRT